MWYRTTCLFARQLEQIELSTTYAQPQKKRNQSSRLTTVICNKLQFVTVSISIFSSIDRLIVASELSTEFNFMYQKLYCIDRNYEIY